MNVLLSCIGRRSYLVRYFQAALAGRGKVIATNTIRDTPGMLAADEAIVVPATQDPGYAEHVVRLCREQEVGLACSLFDMDVAALAPARAKFIAAGTTPAIPSPEVVDICFDKWLTFRFAAAHDLATPRTYRSEADALAAVAARRESFPLIVKPRWGTGSIGVETAYDEDDLRAVAHHVREVTFRSFLAPLHRGDEEGSVLIQERVSGREYGLDVVNDFEGNHACCFVKEKLGMRSGETDAAVTSADGALAQIGAQIAGALRHAGMLDVDVIRDGDRICLLDMNPRFGGHYPFSHLAGANIPAAFIAWAQGAEPDPAWLRIRPDVYGCKDMIPADWHDKAYWGAASRGRT